MEPTSNEYDGDRRRLQSTYFVPTSSFNSKLRLGQSNGNLGVESQRHINPHAGDTYDMGMDDREQQANYQTFNKSPRITHWFSFFIFSLITLGSSIEASEKKASRAIEHKQTYAIACSSMTFVLTLTVVMMHSSAKFYVFVNGTKLEGFLIIILLCFWVAIVAVISDAENGLAVNEEGTVIYGNLYYFSWAGFVCSVLLLISYIRSIYYIDIIGEFRNRSPRLMLWSTLMTTSLVMMGSSASIYDLNCQVQHAMVRFCSRTLLALGLGASGAIVSIVIVGMKIATSYAPEWVERMVSALLFVAMSFGTAYITSESGPGAPLGNLYYSTWASFVTVFLICIGLFDDYQEIERRKTLERRMQEEEEALVDEEAIHHQHHEQQHQHHYHHQPHSNRETDFLDYDDEYDHHQQHYNQSNRSDMMDDRYRSSRSHHYHEKEYEEDNRDGEMYHPEEKGRLRNTGKDIYPEDDDYQYQLQDGYQHESSYQPHDQQQPYERPDPNPTVL